MKPHTILALIALAVAALDVIVTLAVLAARGGMR